MSISKREAILHRRIRKLRALLSKAEKVRDEWCKEFVSTRDALRAALEQIRDYPPRVLESDRVEDMKELAAHALDGGCEGCRP